MPKRRTGVLAWNLDDIAKALHLSPDDVREYFTDGRRVSFVLERRLALEVMHGHVAKSEGAGYDVVDSEGSLWECRSISRGGVYFCPSYMVGSSRSFSEPGFLKKLDAIRGYILSDIEGFPLIKYWLVEAAEVRHWYNSGELGAGTKISRTRALDLVMRE